MSAKYTQEDILERFHLLTLAAEKVVANWESGNLAEAVNGLEQDAQDARDLLHDLGYPKNRNSHV